MSAQRITVPGMTLTSEMIADPIQRFIDERIGRMLERVNGSENPLDVFANELGIAYYAGLRQGAVELVAHFVENGIDVPLTFADPPLWAQELPADDEPT